jgi:hypothetical protein
MSNKARWFIWFVALCLILFVSIFLSKMLDLHPFAVWAIVAVIITTGAILHFHYSGNIKRYPVESYTQLWKDSGYGDTVLYEQGIKSDMNFVPWDKVDKLYMTNVDFRAGMNLTMVDKANQVYTFTILDIDGFKRYLAAYSQFRIENETGRTGL